MKAEWLKIWWLGGDLNTRPRDYDFYVAICKIVSKAANFLTYKPKPQLTIITQHGKLHTQKSAQLDYSLLMDG